MNIIPYAQGQIKDISQLPSHITYTQYQAIRQEIIRYWSNKTRWAKKAEYMQDRDLLFIDLLWQTGGRIDDICQMPIAAFDFNQRELNLYTKKRKKTIVVTMDSDLLLSIQSFIHKYDINDKLFGFTRQNGWAKLKKFGKLSGIEHIHPHMFRHGLAVFLMSKNIPIPIISARLGHANIQITMSMYLKVTPDIQRHHMQNVFQNES